MFLRDIRRRHSKFERDVRANPRFCDFDIGPASVKITRLADRKALMLTTTKPSRDTGKGGAE